MTRRPTSCSVSPSKNAELRAQLAETQEHCIELAVDAGELHARIEALQTELAAARIERDAWRAKAEHLRATAVA